LFSDFRIPTSDFKKLLHQRAMSADAMNAPQEVVLSVEGLKIYFRSEDEVARAVDGVDFEVRRRETVCLVGESGCGKTVSALALLGLIPRPPGEIAGGRVRFC
jgi:ABC-type glutathione transport system ATPase component